MSDQNSWAGRRVLVTGNTGFKGSWMTLWLEAMGAEVLGYALAPPTDPSLFELARLKGCVNWKEGDVEDLDALRGAMDEFQPEVVFHLAAQAMVREGYREPVGTFRTNVMGTVHVLDAIRHCQSVRVAVMVTSDKCYENREWAWGYRENEPMGGYDPYSSSKGCAELVTAAYRSSFFGGEDGDSPGAAVATVRAGNVIGGGDWGADRLVPDAMQAFLAGESLSLRSPGAIRPWQHVLDPISGYLRLAERMLETGAEFSEGWNFGPCEADARSVGWIVERLADLWDGRTHIRQETSPQPHEAHYLKLDSSKARTKLGWQPRLSLEEALGWTVDWFKALQSGADMREVTRGQIQRYREIVTQ